MIQASASNVAAVRSYSDSSPRGRGHALVTIFPSTEGTMWQITYGRLDEPPTWESGREDDIGRASCCTLERSVALASAGPRRGGRHSPVATRRARPAASPPAGATSGAMRSAASATSSQALATKPSESAPRWTTATAPTAAPSEMPR